MLPEEKVRQIINDVLDGQKSVQYLDDNYHPADIAEAIDLADGEERKLSAFRALGVDMGSEVLPLLGDEARDLILKRTEAEGLGDLIGEMDSDDAADILGDVTDEKAEDILDTVPDEVDQEVSMLLEYDEESAGGIMQIELVEANEKATVAETIEKLRAKADEIKDVHNIFVVDENRKLKGVAPLRDLILNPAKKTIGEIIDSQPPIYATVDADQEKVAWLFKRYDLVSLPVVDNEMVLKGRVVIDDVVDVMEEEADEDIMTMAGADDEALTQTHTIREMVQYRLPWLGASLIGGFITGALIWSFKMAIAEAIALAAFIPVVMGMSGNVGTQSSALVIRGMATGKIAFSSLWAYIYREFKIGLALGFICGVIAGTGAQIWHGSYTLGLIVGISIFLSISLAALLGALIPFFFRWAKFDPAIAGGPIVLALNDISGLLIFFLVANLLLGLF